MYSDSENKKAYFKAYHQRHKEARNALRRASARAAYAANPEAVKAERRAASKLYRSRRALKELAEIRAGHHGNVK